MTLTPDSLGPTVDVAMLADAVQSVRSKLYVLGGGWDTLWVRSFPARHPSLGIGLRIRVPSSWGQDLLRLSVELQDADGARVLPQPLSHTIRLQVPDGPSVNTDYGVVRSFTFNNLVFQAEGSYSFVITIDDEPASRLRFAVRQRPEGPSPAS